MLALQGSTRERQLTILDLPLDLLKRIVEAVDSIQHLHTLAQVGLVSKSFAAVVKQQQHITVFGRDVQRLDTWAGHLTLEQFPMCLKFVTYLELQQVDMTPVMCMVQMASSFRGLLKLDVCFKRNPQPSWAAAFFFESLVLSGASGLQELLIRHDTGIQLKAESPGDPLRQHGGLACITAGSLGVLRMLVRCAAAAAAFGGRTDVNPQTDQKMLSLLPSLQWLEIGDEPLLTPFNGTVPGKLTSKTSDTFSHATVGHVTGDYACPSCSLIDMRLFPPLSSITSWHSKTLVSPRYIAQLAPNLTVLNIKIIHSSDSWVDLTPNLISIDVSKPRHLGAMCVRGAPSTCLTHMCIQGHPLWFHKELYNWARAKQSQPHIADLDVQVKFNKSLRGVVMTSTYCSNNLLSALCMDFSHGCVAVTTVDLPQM